MSSKKKEDTIDEVLSLLEQYMSTTVHTEQEIIKALKKMQETLDKIEKRICVETTDGGLPR